MWFQEVSVADRVIPNLKCASLAEPYHHFSDDFPLPSDAVQVDYTAPTYPLCPPIWLTNKDRRNDGGQRSQLKRLATHSKVQTFKSDEKRDLCIRNRGAA